MTEWKTLRVPEDAYEQAKEQKEENDRTWGQQVVRDNGGVDHSEEYLDELEDRIVVRLSREKDADIGTVEQNILNRLDDLQSQLPKDVAGELR